MLYSRTQAVRSPMHEMSLAISILETAQKILAQQGGGNLQSVKVAVGELSAVEPDLLEFAWVSLLKGTETPDARLEIEWRSSRHFCPSCRNEASQPKGTFPVCSSCGGSLTVTGGKELDILELSFSRTVGST